MQDISENLQKTKLFRYLNKEQTSLLHSLGQIREHAGEEAIVRQGKVGDGLHLILKGKANVALRVLGDDTISLAVLKEGNFFGEPNLLTALQTTATVSAYGHTTSFFLPRTCFDALSTNMPDIRYALSRALVEDVIKRHELIEDDISKLLAKQRVSHISLKKGIENHTKVDIKKLQPYSLLQKFSSNQLKEIVSNSRIAHTSEASVLMGHRQANASAFLILSGAVMANITTKTKSTHFAVYAPNTLVCPTSLVDGKNELFNYNTCGHAELLEIPYEYLKWVSQNDLPLWYKFFDLFAYYIFDLQKHLNGTFARFKNEIFF